jgi:hypothetical protein
MKPHCVMTLNLLGSTPEAGEWIGCSCPHLWSSGWATFQGRRAKLRRRKMGSRSRAGRTVVFHWLPARHISIFVTIRHALMLWAVVPGLFASGRGDSDPYGSRTTSCPQSSAGGGRAPRTDAPRRAPDAPKARTVGAKKRAGTSSSAHSCSV